MFQHFSYLAREQTMFSLPLLASILLCALLIGVCADALAHTGERAFILLLPTKLYTMGGALVVGLSFAIAVLLPVGNRSRIGKAVLRLPLRIPHLGEWPGAVTLIVLVILIAAGFGGSRDPLANPLPLMVWSAWWVGFTFVHALLGNLWAIFNPWHCAHRLIMLLPGLRGLRDRPLLRYRDHLAYWPAVVLFFAFVWFELIYPAPQDPAILARVVLVYFLITIAAMLVFGKQIWLQYGECFSVFFRMVSWLSPFNIRGSQERIGGIKKRTVTLGWPGARLLQKENLVISMVAFILLALASVSFDGLSRSFWWMDVVGENPLEYPGRTVLIPVNSMGLFITFAVFGCAYGVTIGLSQSLGGARVKRSAGSFVLSIVPIAFGYHFAHYLPAFLVDIQYAARAVSDPFNTGWNLFGTRDLHVTASFLTNHQSVKIIWNLQVVIIVAAHVLAVAIAHIIALRYSSIPRTVITSQLPATALMIGYTLFGLWLLSSPAVA